MKKTDPFKYFTERVKHWTNHFGLLNWDVNVHEDENEYDGVLASTFCNISNKRADIYLVMDWNGNPPRATLIIMVQISGIRRKCRPLDHPASLMI